MEKIKKNWKVILIVLLTLFSLNKCTQSCTRGQKLNKAEYAVDSLTTVVNGLTRDTAELNNKIKMLNGFNDKMNENIRQQNVKDSINAANNAQQTKQTQQLINRLKRAQNAAK